MIKWLIIDFNRTIYNPETNKLMDWAFDMLERAKSLDLKMCLLSKAQERDRRHEISHLGLDIFFDEILVVDWEKSYEHFQQCFDKMELEAQDVAIIWDRLKWEIYLWNYFGCKTIWFRNWKFASETPKANTERADHVIKELKDLFKYIK